MAGRGMAAERTGPRGTRRQAGPAGGARRRDPEAGPEGVDVGQGGTYRRASGERQRQRGAGPRGVRLSQNYRRKAGPRNASESQRPCGDRQKLCGIDCDHAVQSEAGGVVERNLVADENCNLP